jgi:hypothetical protein
MANVHCPPALAADVIDRGVFALERRATPDPDTARALMRLARRVELATGQTSNAIPWLASYIAACTSVGAR